jgi:hypothetical protein
MNEQIQKLVRQAGLKQAKDFKSGDEVKNFVFGNGLEKFAESIVRECINQAHSVGDLRGANDDMIYGADTAAARISKHFGIKNG